MSGKIELKIRKGIPKRTDLNYYPYWSWEVTGECGNKVTISPTWDDLKEALKKTIKHELKVDLVSKRNPDKSRYMKKIQEICEMSKSLKMEINDYDLEEIYKECVKK